VQLGAKSDVDVEIIQGLAQNDTVIVHAGEKVAEGVKVTAR
jgi:hypothetical protein